MLLPFRDFSVAPRDASVGDVPVEASVHDAPDVFDAVDDRAADSAPELPGTPGDWTRVFRIDAEEGCPPPLRAAPGQGVCVRPSMEGRGSVTTLTFQSPVPFREVQGRATLRAYGTVDAFGNPPPNNTWDTLYVDGMSLSELDTRTEPTVRRHLWTWALGGEPLPGPAVLALPCPCRGGPAPVAQVGRDHYCAPTLAEGSGTMTTFWRDIPGSTWLTLDAVGGCASGDPEGRFQRALSAERGATFELRIVLSGAPHDSVAGGEDLGIGTFEVLVR